MRVLKKIGNSFCLSYLLLASTTAWASASIRAEVNPNPLPEDESLLLRISIEIEGQENVEKPSFSAPDFDIVGQSNAVSASSQFINGKFTYTRSQQYSFVLFPKKSGTLLIKDISTRAGNDILKAADINVIVQGQVGSNSISPRPSLPAPAPNTKNEREYNQHPSELYSDFTVYSQASKTSVYVGEPILVDYYLYDNNNIISADIKKWPTFNGFYKEDVAQATKIDFQPVWVNNKQMRRAFIARYALYPFRPGKIKVEPLTITATYLWRRRNMDDTDPFGMFFGRAETRNATHASREITIDVLPLPQEGRPANFTGAVGKFQINSELDKSSVAVGAPLNLKTEISGSGNFQAIENVKVNLPPDFEIYESNTVGKGSGASAPDHKITFNTLILPRKPGKYSIPPISWNYFDPESKRYITLTTQPHQVEVTGEANNNPNPTLPNADNSTKVATTPSPVKAELRYFKSVNEVLDTSVSLAQRIWWYIAAILLAINLAAIMHLNRNSLVQWRKLFARSSQKKIQNALSLANAKVKDRQEFFGNIHNAIHIILEHFLGTSTLGMTLAELEQIWREKNLPATTFHTVENILNRSDSERFSSNSKKPLSESERDQVVAELKKIIQEAKIRTKHS